MRGDRFKRYNLPVLFAELPGTHMTYAVHSLISVKPHIIYNETQKLPARALKTKMLKEGPTGTRTASLLIKPHLLLWGILIWGIPSRPRFC